MQIAYYSSASQLSSHTLHFMCFERKICFTMRINSQQQQRRKKQQRCSEFCVYMEIEEDAHNWKEVRYLSYFSCSSFISKATHNHMFFNCLSICFEILLFIHRLHMLSVWFSFVYIKCVIYETACRGRESSLLFISHKSIHIKTHNISQCVPQKVSNFIHLKKLHI